MGLSSPSTATMIRARPLGGGGHAYGRSFEPMAIAIIFGLILGTLLMRGVVPILYSRLFREDFKGFLD